MTNKPSSQPIGEFVSIYQRGRKAIWTACFQYGGQHHRRSLKTRNFRVARSRAAALDRELSAGVFSVNTQRVQSGGKTIETAIDEYISHCETEGIRRKTRIKYRGILKKFSAFADGENKSLLTEIDLPIVDRYRTNQKQNLSPKSMYHEGGTMKRFFEWCRQRRYMPENPLAERKFSPPAPTEKGVLTLAQVDMILMTATGRLLTVLAMLAFTGMRSGELQRLLGQDVDIDGNWIKIESRPGAETKSGRNRKVPVHPRLRAMLATFPTRPRGHFYFTAEPSRRYPDGDHHFNVKRLNESFLVLLKKLGISAGRDEGFTIHSLRHFFRTHCVNGGVPERAVDIWVGHEPDRRSVQSVYYHLSDQASQEFMTKVPFGDGTPAAYDAN